MRYIKYLKVTNFKIFNEEVTVSFDDITVLIGPNNSGKTSVIQALALWHQGIQTFFDARTEIDKKSGERKAKGKLDNKLGIGINRLEIAQVPVSDTRQLFHKAYIRKGKENQRIIISVGLWHEGIEKECTIEFKYFKSEILYCYLSEALAKDIRLLTFAANLNINLLYPMSGLATEETMLQEGAIRKQIGRGQTANLLRNVCYYLHINQPEDWELLTKLITQLFAIQLEIPQRLSTDDLTLTYNYIAKEERTEGALNILQAGRGQQQVILILAFVLWKKKSIILIDEPDAHLEVLRQSQIIEVLNKLAKQYGNQLIIATHSEVIMNEMDQLTFLMYGKYVNIGTDTKPIKSALKEFGFEHYYKAKINQRILYLEGTTDKQILQAPAEKLNHPLQYVLMDKIFVYYTQSPDISHTEWSDNVAIADYYYAHKRHFQAIMPIVENLKGIALLDNDNKNVQDETKGNLTTLFWRWYEIENYFITPQSVLAFAETYFIQRDGALFAPVALNKFNITLEKHLLLPIFNNNVQAILQYQALPTALKQEIYNTQSARKKASELLTNVFEDFAKQENQSVLLRKGEFYQIIPFCDDLNEEVKEKLDLLYNHLEK
jgi:predicted ATPase